MKKIIFILREKVYKIKTIVEEVGLEKRTQEEEISHLTIFKKCESEQEALNELEKMKIQHESFFMSELKGKYLVLAGYEIEI